MNNFSKLSLALVAVVMSIFMSAYLTILPVGGYKVGDYVADFSLPNINGESLSLKDFKDAKGFIIVFTCNTCPYSKLYESRIIELDKKYADKGFPVIAINPNDVDRKPGDSMEKMIKRAKKKNYTFPYLRDDPQEVTKAFGALKTPHTFVLNKESGDKLRLEFIGGIDNSPSNIRRVSETYVEDAVDALLSGKKPEIQNKKAIGCSIRWKKS